MECKNCGTINSPRARFCIKCSYKLLDDNVPDQFCPICKKLLLYPDKPCPYCNNSLPSSEHNFCDECKSTIKKSLVFSNSKKLTPLETEVMQVNSSAVFCDNCLNLKKKQAIEKIMAYKKKFFAFLEQMPVLSIESPEILTIIKYSRIITSQSVVIIDKLQEVSINSSNWNNIDVEFEKKLDIGEKSCVLSLKKKALSLGANAIIGCDIDYAELSNSKRTFLIAMMGTAVVVEEFNVLSEHEQRIYNCLLEE